MTIYYGVENQLVQYTINLGAQDYVSSVMSEMMQLEEQQKDNNTYDHSREHLVSNLQAVTHHLGIAPKLADDVVGLVYAAVSSHYPFKQPFLM